MKSQLKIGLIILTIGVLITLGFIPFRAGWPSSDNRLDFIWKLDIYSSVYEFYHKRAEDVPVILSISMPLSLADLSSPLTIRPASIEFIKSYNPDFLNESDEIDLQGYNPTDHYEKYSNFYINNNPKTLVGTYISGGDCRRYVIKAYPRGTIDCSEFLKEELLPSWQGFNDSDRFKIDISKPSVSKKFADLIIKEAISRNRPFIYFDTITHPGSGGLARTNITWENVTDFLSYIHQNLTEKGIKVVVNVSVAPWILAKNDFEDSDLLQEAVDGMSFEMPFHRYIRDKQGYIEDEIKVYRRWLNAGKAVFLIPGGGKIPKARFNDERLMAAMAMIMRNQSHSLFVLRPYWEDKPDWINWSEQFGKPLGEYTVSSGKNGIIFKREFVNGNIYVQYLSTINKKEITFILPIIDGQYEVKNEPIYGKLNIKNLPEVTYIPDETYIGVESFFWGANFKGDFYSDIVVVSMKIENK